jgi:hypothetical protein
MTRVVEKESGRGQPHSKTLARFRKWRYLRKVLECGCPLPLLHDFERLAKIAFATDRKGGVRFFRLAWASVAGLEQDLRREPFPVLLRLLKSAPERE